MPAREPKAKKKSTNVSAVPAQTRSSLLQAALAFLRRYSFESLLSLCLIALVSPITDDARMAVFGEGEGPSFYVDTIACPTSISGREAETCHLLNLKIPGGVRKKRLSRIEIFSVESSTITLRMSGTQVPLQIDDELFKAYRVASSALDREIEAGSLTVVSALGRFGKDATVTVALDGANQQARQLAIAEGRILFLTEYWRQVLLVAIATIFAIRYRHIAIERLDKR
jgi:hypothetical protein